jgi:hypothetical protein
MQPNLTEEQKKDLNKVWLKIQPKTSKLLGYFESLEAELLAKLP